MAPPFSLACLSALFFALVTCEQVYQHNYGFVACLYSKKNESAKCPGVIVTPRWILNYCDYHTYVYDAVSVGMVLGKPSVDAKSYSIILRKIHSRYRTIKYPSMSKLPDTSNMFSAKHAIFLDQTNKRMKMQGDKVMTMPISFDRQLPPYGVVISFKGVERGFELQFSAADVMNDEECSRYYYIKHRLILDTATQYCTDNQHIPLKKCCGNHGIMGYKNKLIGLMAWSTGCFDKPEPWVFTKLEYYYNWIGNLTADGD